MLCQCGPRVSVLDVETTTLVDTIPRRSESVNTGDEEDEEDESTDSVITFTLDPTSKNLITSHKSGLLCTWDWNGKILTLRYYFNFFISNYYILYVILKKKNLPNHGAIFIKVQSYS